MKLRVIDDLSPEDIAMLQALYSRSAASVEEHLEKVKATGSSKFMEKYYVGYSHKSIADCGSTTMFIEGVSLLAAKAIQDWPLYSGQETSTRYIDMGRQPIVDPFGTPQSKAVLNRWMDFYNENQDRVYGLLVRRYPKRPNEKDETYTRAIKARTFDVLRGFLPAGITTQLSWHTNLRQAGDHLTQLGYHPSPEMHELADALRMQLAERYPSSSFAISAASVSGVDSKNLDARRERAEWEGAVAEAHAYSVRSQLTSDAMLMRANFCAPNFDTDYRDLLRSRPKGCVLPHFMSDLGQITFEFLLDFGSFRDIQRHRNGVCRMPLLNTSWGFNKWYLEQLGDPDNGDVGGLRDTAVALIHEQQTAIANLGLGDPNGRVKRQYYTALGFQVPCQVTYGLPALVYVLELRSGKTIHPTLRKVVHEMIRQFRQTHPGVTLHVDMDPDDWDIRRGDQTITMK